MPFKDAEKRRAYQREYMQRWYQENKQKHIGYVRNHGSRIDAWFVEFKKTLSCAVCGENHPACLDFHHLNPAEKKLAVSRRQHRPSLKALTEEIAKCKVLCANCHRKEHWMQREFEKEKAVL